MDICIFFNLRVSILQSYIDVQINRFTRANTFGSPLRQFFSVSALCEVIYLNIYILSWKQKLSIILKNPKIYNTTVGYNKMTCLQMSIFFNDYIVFKENKNYQTCQVFKTWQVLKPKYLSEHL